VLPWEQPGGFEATTELVRAIADHCGASQPDVLPFMNSANTVRDMDQIRRAVGEDKIAYYGASAGTNLGAIYASLFPGRTDRFVLDSALDPHGRWRKDWRAFGPGAEIRFPDLARFVADNDAVYHLGATPPAARAKFLELVAVLDRAPLVLSEGTVVSGAVLRLFTFGGLYANSRFAFTAQLWQQVNESPSDAAGLEALLLTQAMPGNPGVPIDNYPSVQFANLCGDVEWSRSVAQYRAEYDADRARFPLFGAIGSNIHPCAFWPFPPIEPLTEIAASGPRNILIAQNVRDPATPHPGALEMHEALGRRSAMVTVDQGGHGVLFGPNRCGNDAIAAFLSTGVLPRHDQFCPAEPSQVADRTATPVTEAVTEWQRHLAPPVTQRADRTGLEELTDHR
jgi:pimeloyl-ACP methyl ester carboxylesterase